MIKAFQSLELVGCICFSVLALVELLKHLSSSEPLERSRVAVSSNRLTPAIESRLTLSRWTKIWRIYRTYVTWKVYRVVWMRVLTIWFSIVLDLGLYLLVANASAENSFAFLWAVLHIWWQLILRRDISNIDKSGKTAKSAVQLSCGYLILWRIPKYSIGFFLFLDEKFFILIRNGVGF